MRIISSMILGFIIALAISGGVTNFSSVVDAGDAPKLALGDPLPENLFIELAKAVNPAVVNIYTTQIPRHIRPNTRFGRDPFFEFFAPFMGPMQQQPRQSLGTGFIIRKDGLIITNAHVVDQADIIRVKLSENGEEQFEATLVGKDRRTDIALIKIATKKDLPVAQLGTSKDLQVGEWVAAFGNPFGHGHTMTKGIVSAIGREIDELNKFPFIQTDASINPGNSGGPLVNAKGLVIGVNTAIDARAQGIGFAIPIDDVKGIIPILEKNGAIKRGFIGVYMAQVSPNEAQALNLKQTEGALITQVMPGGPAAKAGLEPYDLIIQFGKAKIQSPTDLANVVMDKNVGDKLKVTYIRDGQQRSTAVIIGEHPEDNQKEATNKTYQGQKAPLDIGFSMANYTKQLARELGLPTIKSSHPVVLDVIPGSPASRAGLSPGDIILDINRQSVSSAREAIKAFKEKGLYVLRVLRQQHVALIYIQAG